MKDLSDLKKIEEILQPHYAQIRNSDNRLPAISGCKSDDERIALAEGLRGQANVWAIEALLGVLNHPEITPMEPSRFDGLVRRLVARLTEDGAESFSLEGYVGFPNYRGDIRAQLREDLPKIAEHPSDLNRRRHLGDPGASASPAERAVHRPVWGEDKAILVQAPPTKHRDTAPTEQMLPPNTDPLTFSALSRITGEYLPRIAGATDAERKKLLCELACQIFDISTEPRAALFKSPEDLPAFQIELDTCLSRMVMPLLDRVRLSEEEVEAIQLAVAGRRQHWLGVVVGRSASAEIPPAGPSGTESDQSPAIPIDKPGTAQADGDPIQMERRRAVDAYIEECCQARSTDYPGRYLEESGLCESQRIRALGAERCEQTQPHGERKHHSGSEGQAASQRSRLREASSQKSRLVGRSTGRS
jgi:hypothetical protein